MRQLLLAAILLACLSSVAQSGMPKGVPNVYSKGWIRHGYLQADSAIVIPIRTANFTPRFLGTMVLDPTGGDTVLKIWYGKWVLAGRGGSVSSGGTGTVSFNGRVSNTIVPQTGDYTPAMVGLGNVPNITEAQRNAAVATFTNKNISGLTNNLSNVNRSSVIGLNDILAAKLDSAGFLFKLDSATKAGVIGFVTESPIAVVKGADSTKADTVVLVPGTLIEKYFASASVTTPKLANNAVTAIKIAPLSVENDKLGTGAVSTDKMMDAAVTEEKLSPTVAYKLNNPNTGLAAEVSLTFAGISPSTTKRFVEVTVDETNSNSYTLYYHTGTSLRRITSVNAALPNAGAVGDTIAINLSSTSNAQKITWGGWNNIAVANGTYFTAQNLLYKETGDPSTIDVDSIYNGTILTASTECVDSSLAPNVVLKYYSQATGASYLTGGGRIYYFGGFNPAKTYDIVYLFASNQSSTRTISSQGQSTTVTPTPGCTNFVRLAGLVPDGAGKIQVRNVGGTASATTFATAFYIIEHD